MEVAWNRYPDLLQLPPYQEHVKPFVEKPKPGLGEIAIKAGGEVVAQKVVH